MITKLFGRIAMILCIAAVAVLSLIGVKAQQAKNNSNNALLLTTNWVGYLVIGDEEPIDSIARGPFPTTERQIELGLRSDGTVIWRRTAR